MIDLFSTMVQRKSFGSVRVDCSQGQFDTLKLEFSSCRPYIWTHSPKTSEYKNLHEKYSMNALTLISLGSTVSVDMFFQLMVCTLIVCRWCPTFMQVTRIDNKSSVGIKICRKRRVGHFIFGQLVFLSPQKHLQQFHAFPIYRVLYSTLWRNECPPNQHQYRY